MQLPQIPMQIDDFEFSIEGTDFGKSLKLCDEVIKFSDADKMMEDLNMIVCTGREVFLMGRTIDTFIIYQLDVSEVSGIGAALVDFSVLGPVTKKGRVKIRFAGGELRAKSKTTNLTNSVRQVSLDQLKTLEVTIRNIELKNDADVFGSELVDDIKRAVEMSFIPDLYTDGSTNSHIEVRKGSLKVVTSSNFTCAQYDKDLTVSSPDIRISLGADMLRLLYKVVGSSEAQFYVSGANFVASAANFLVLLPPVRSHKGDFDRFETFEATLGEPAARATADHDLVLAVNTLAGLVNSNKALKGHSVKFALAVKPGTALLKFNTDGQSLTEKIGIATKDTFSFNADIRLMQLLMKGVGQGIKAGESPHQLSVYGPTGKYKAFMLNYTMPDFRIKYFMQCTS